MSTREEHIADEKADIARIQLMEEGWWECDCGCGAIYVPNWEKIEINGKTYSLSCLSDEYGLIPDPRLTRPSVPASNSKPQVYR